MHMTRARHAQKILKNLKFSLWAAPQAQCRLAKLLECPAQSQSAKKERGSWLFFSFFCCRLVYACVSVVCCCYFIDFFFYLVSKEICLNISSAQGKGIETSVVTQTEKCSLCRTSQEMSLTNSLVQAFSSQHHEEGESDFYGFHVYHTPMSSFH